MDDTAFVERDGRPGITLVLGGGGARGLAHFGVFQVLEEAQVPIRAIAGNSAGALAGAVYLQSGSAQAAIERVLGYLEGPGFQRHKLGLRLPHQENGAPRPTFLNRLLSGWRRQVAMHLLFRRESLFHTRRLETVIHALVDEAALEDLPRPLRIVALDLMNGEERVLERGPLRRTLLASCSVAGFFPPVLLDGRRLMDAGQADNLPVQVGAELGRPVVAVNLSAEIEVRGEYPTGIEIMFRSEEIGSRWNTRLRLRDADVHVAPRLNGRYWLDFSAPREALAAGVEAAREALPDIQAALAPAARAERPSPRLDPSARLG